MKRIPLTQNKFALVDDNDFKLVSVFKWYAQRIGKNFYAVRMKNRKCIYMHRFILGNPIGKLIDHIDSNGLNNLRLNLRSCTQAENLRNRGNQKNNSSGISGVSWSKSRRRWHSYVNLNGKKIHLGSFFDKTSAKHARIKGIKTYFKEFAYLNYTNV